MNHGFCIANFSLPDRPLVPRESMLFQHDPDRSRSRRVLSWGLIGAIFVLNKTCEWPGSYSTLKWMVYDGKSHSNGWFMMMIHYISGWCFGTMGFDDFPYIGNVIPTDELIFLRGVETTNQILWEPFPYWILYIYIPNYGSKQCLRRYLTPKSYLEYFLRRCLDP